MRALTNSEMRIVAGGFDPYHNPMGDPDDGSNQHPFARPFQRPTATFQQEESNVCTVEDTREANEEYERHQKQLIQNAADVARTTCDYGVESVDTDGFSCLPIPTD